MVNTKSLSNSVVNTVYSITITTHRNLGLHCITNTHESMQWFHRLLSDGIFFFKLIKVAPFIHFQPHTTQHSFKINWHEYVDEPTSPYKPSFRCGGVSHLKSSISFGQLLITLFWNGLLLFQYHPRFLSVSPETNCRHSRPWDHKMSVKTEAVVTLVNVNRCRRKKKCVSW